MAMPIIASARLPAELVDRVARMRQRVAAAEDEGRRVVEAALDEAKRVRAEAAARGREEGRAEVTGALADAARVRDGALAAAEAELVDLAFEVARRVVGGAVERGAVVEVAARALEAARLRERVVLHASPEDVAALEAAEPALAAALRSGGFGLRADVSLARGGVVVETEIGRIEAGLEGQLASLRAALERASP
jgi:type III secretion protein L